MQDIKDTNIFLTLSKKGIKDTEKKAFEDTLNNYGDTEPEKVKDEMTHENAYLEISESYFDKEDETLNIIGNIMSMGSTLGYCGLYIKITPEVMITMIDHYMKKLGKLKTVMEAIK